MKSIANSNYCWKNYLNSARISFNAPYREILLKKIAADLKLSVETVKTQRKKAKRILRERYTLLFKTFGILF